MDLFAQFSWPHCHVIVTFATICDPVINPDGRDSRLCSVAMAVVIIRLWPDGMPVPIQLRKARVSFKKGDGIEPGYSDKKMDL